MKAANVNPAYMDEYIALYPPNVQKLLGSERQPLMPGKIKYQIPTFTLHDNLAPFGAFKNNIGFYPAPSG